MTIMTTPARPVLQAQLSYRKSVDALQGWQLDALRRAYSRSMALSDERGFQYWAGVHGLPLPKYCQHGTVLFLPWHRSYLYFFELTLKDADAVVSLPWWDWTSPEAHERGLPRAYTEETPDAPNPLRDAEINETARQQAEGSEDWKGPVPERTYRDPEDPGALPTPDDVEAVLSLGDFFDFSHQLELMHDNVHVWIGGTVGEIPFAAYDPIFWAHHAMIDRLWRLWQLRHSDTALPRSFLRTTLSPFPMTVADTLSTSTLGYDYAVFSSRTLVDGQG